MKRCSPCARLAHRQCTAPAVCGCAQAGHPGDRPAVERTGRLRAAAPWRVELARRLYEEGHPVKEVARRLGISYTGAHVALRRSGVVMPREAARARAAESARLYRLGFTQAEIAGRLGIASRTVSHHVRKVGARRPPSRRRLARTLAMLDDGLSQSEAARREGVSKSLISLDLKLAHRLNLRRTDERH